MNPYSYIIDNFYKDTSARFGLDAAAVLLLQVMATGYSGGMAVGENPYRYILSVLDQHGPNDFLKKLRADWNTRANPHI